MFYKENVTVNRFYSGFLEFNKIDLFRYKISVMEGTFHRRVLNLPGIAFSSEEGKNIFRKALEEGHMEGYFHLAEHFITQGHPAFCGIGSLTMALNSLLLDPKRIWQGVWRWFDESMLDCCEPLDIVRMKGITLPKLACLAKCNGAHSVLKYGTDITLEEFRRDIILVSTAPLVNDGTKTCFGNKSSQTTGTSVCCGNKVSDNSTVANRDTSIIINEKEVLSDSCCEKKIKSALSEKVNVYTRNVMVVSYNRRDLSQTGSGHFSPIGGYCVKRDLVLIMDVARFKYPPHWVPLPLLFTAMQAIDPETERCRGYLLLSALPEMLHQCECSAPCSTVNESTTLPIPAIPVSSESHPIETDAVTLLSAVPQKEVLKATEEVSVRERRASSVETMTRLHSFLEHSCSNCCR